ncbi:unnamed protein product [Ectocarpus sp. CCAP 1310/34]|nr:unnamed protein product [Ectocarpus sp. CCAP 1310/34]
MQQEHMTCSRTRNPRRPAYQGSRRREPAAASGKLRALLRASSCKGICDYRR